jgi:hypothetical protein
MLKGKDFGAAIAAAIEKKLANGSVKSKAAIARHFEMKPSSLADWVKKGSVSKDKLPELWRYFSDVAGPKHWGMTEDEWPSGLASAPGKDLSPSSNGQEALKKAISKVSKFPDWPFPSVSLSRINALPEHERMALDVTLETMVAAAEARSGKRSASGGA